MFCDVYINFQHTHLSYTLDFCSVKTNAQVVIMGHYSFPLLSLLMV